jgi:hypothetical protein
MTAEETAAQTEESPASDARTAMVIVHGLGERRPMQTLEDFANTALRPRTAHGEKRWGYYSLPAEITGSYEARRFTSAQADIYEYHWSYLMTANKYAGAMPMTLRLVLRRASNVPDALLGVWRYVWSVLMAILLAIPALFVTGYALNTDVPAWIIGLVISAVVLIFWFGLYRMAAKALVNKTTTSLVDVARYLDPSPYSYAARRAIRGGLVDLLHALHDGRYSRVVVVAHGVGTYISYDALTAFWAETHKLHAGPPAGSQSSAPIELGALDGLEKAADRLVADGDADGALDDFHDLQFDLWQDLREQGNPWRITDFVTVGAPMALADLLVTRPGLFSGFKKTDGGLRRELLDGLIRRGALVRCPPRPETLPVDGNEHPPARYHWKDGEAREVLGPQSPFAVTRWTNLWFPVIRGSLQGDWFGGALGPLFGPGIRDIAIQGNRPERFKRGSAHTEYFRHPEKDGEGDMAWHLRSALALQTDSAQGAIATDSLARQSRFL